MSTQPASIQNVQSASGVLVQGLALQMEAPGDALFLVGNDAVVRLEDLEVSTPVSTGIIPSSSNGVVVINCDSVVLNRATVVGGALSFPPNGELTASFSNVSAYDSSFEGGPGNGALGCGLFCSTAGDPGAPGVYLSSATLSSSGRRSGETPAATCPSTVARAAA